MNVFHYVLMTTGIQKKTEILGEIYDVDWKAPYFSKPKKIIAPDEDIARFEIRQKLKGKWTGFQILRPKKRRK